MLHPLLPKVSHASVHPWLPGRRHLQDAGFTSCSTITDLVLQHSADSRQPHTAQEDGILTHPSHPSNPSHHNLPLPS